MILECVNSFLDRPGNIGLRTSRILKEAGRHSRSECLCISRGGYVEGSTIRCIGMGPLGHLPRFLNALRIYLLHGFNHRRIDICLFEAYAVLALAANRNAGIDVAHVWEYAPTLIELLKRRGIPVVLDVPIAPTAYAERLWREGRCDHLMRDPKQVALESRAFALADRLLVPSDFVAEELVATGVPMGKIRTVYFGVDSLCSLNKATPDFHRGESGVYSGINWVLLGNVNFRKGVAELLTAWEDPLFFGDTLHLCGRVNSEVRGLIAKSRGNVVTPGFVDPRQYLRRCHVFVMPSWMEGSSKAVFEAMAMGLPAIVSRSTGSVVRDGEDGFVIEAGDVGALVQAMLRFKREPESISLMGKNAFGRMKLYTWERYAQGVLAVYDEFNPKQPS